MDPDRIAELATLVRQQEAARVAAERRIAAIVAASVRNFTDWYDHPKITSWTRSLVRLIQPVQRGLARSTDAYLARASSITTGRTIRPVGAVNVAQLRGAQSHEGAYGRVADTYRYQEFRLQQPEAPQLVSPQQAAATRAEAVAHTDAMLVPRAQSQQFMTRTPKVTGYRRVIHPELSKTGTCGLCVAASDRLYGPKELMPIHPPTCHCLPMPVFDFDDPGSLLNKGDLTKLYEDAGGHTYGGELKRTRYKIVQHGELGPVLVRQDAEFRTAADVARDSS